MTVAAIPDPQPRFRPRLSLSPGVPARDGALTVSVRGEVDAANAKDFAVAVCNAVDGAAHVTLDLSDLGFLALDGVAALHAINAHLSRAQVPWCVVPGSAVSRALTLCDPVRLIPLVRRPSPARRGTARLRLVEPL